MGTFVLKPHTSLTYTRGFDLREIPSLLITRASKSMSDEQRYASVLNFNSLTTKGRRRRRGEGEEEK